MNYDKAFQDERINDETFISCGKKRGWKVDLELLQFAVRAALEPLR